MQSNFNTSIDIFGVDKQGNTALLLACNQNEIEVVDYLLANVYNDVTDDKQKEKLVYNRYNNLNALHYIARWNNVEMIEKIDEYCGDKISKDMRNACDNTKCTPLLRACNNNSVDCARKLITKENVNMAGFNKQSPLYGAIDNGNTEIVKFLCSINISDSISDYKVDITMNDIELCVKNGSTTILCSLLLAQIKQNSVDNVESLGKCDILDDNIINGWLNDCHKQGNWSMYGFLSKLKEKGLRSKEKQDAFLYIKRLLRMTVDENTNKNEDLYNRMRKGMST